MYTEPLFQQQKALEIEIDGGGKGGVQRQEVLADRKGRTSPNRAFSIFPDHPLGFPDSLPPPLSEPAAAIRTANRRAGLTVGGRRADSRPPPRGALRMGLRACRKDFAFQNSASWRGKHCEVSVGAASKTENGGEENGEGNQKRAVPIIKYRRRGKGSRQASAGSARINAENREASIHCVQGAPLRPPRQREDVRRRWRRMRATATVSEPFLRFL